MASAVTLEVIFVVLTVAILPTSCFTFGNQVLYTENDPIVILNGSTFKPTVLERDKSWIVQFFNSWCGHCIQFAPIWKELANDVIKWKPVIDIAAIDCALEANIPICREYEIVAYPTIKLFKPKSASGDLGSRLYADRTIVGIRQGMIDFIEMHMTDGAANSWLRFQPISHSTLDAVWNEAPIEVKNVAIIIENNSSYIGREVILDSLEWKIHYHVRRVLSTNQMFLSAINVAKDTLPQMITFTRNGEASRIESDGSREDFIQHIESLLIKANILKENIAPQNLTDDATDEKKLGEGIGADDNRNRDDDLTNAEGSDSKTKIAILQPVELDQVYEVDLENTLQYILHHEVLLQKSIKDEKLNALQAFINVLKKYFPGRPAVKNYLIALERWVRNKTDISGEIFQYYIETLQRNKSVFMKRDWVGCRGSKPHLRGYTCGLWTLFHALTVASYRRQENEKRVDLEVLKAIRGYVMHFFGCEHCVRHFTKMSENLEDEVTRPDEMVLWLWQAHNRVNTRLKGEASEDPIHPKVQFPLETLCSNCQTWRTDGTQQWDLHAVLEFLLNHYGESGITLCGDCSKQRNKEYESLHSEISKDNSTIKEKRNVALELISKNMEEPNTIRRPVNRWIFSTVDVSLCVLLYISSLLILMMGYFCIIVRRRSVLGLRKKLQYMHFV